MTTYGAKFITAWGEPATIERDTPVSVKISIKRSTRAARDLGIREGYWEGLILAKHNLLSGEYLTVRDGKHLVQSTNIDPESKETAMFLAKCNSEIQHQQYTETLDEYNQIVEGWTTISTVPSYCEIITYRLRQIEQGLLDSTKYTFQVPKTLGVELLDRIIHNGENLRVDSVDDVGMSGVWRLQVSDDVRP